MSVGANAIDQPLAILILVLQRIELLLRQLVDEHLSELHFLLVRGAALDFHRTEVAHFIRVIHRVQHEPVLERPQDHEMRAM